MRMVQMYMNYQMHFAAQMKIMKMMIVSTHQKGESGHMYIACCLCVTTPHLTSIFVLHTVQNNINTVNTFKS